MLCLFLVDRIVMQKWLEKLGRLWQDILYYNFYLVGFARLTSAEQFLLCISVQNVQSLGTGNKTINFTE